MEEHGIPSHKWHFMMFVRGTPCSFCMSVVLILLVSLIILLLTISKRVGLHTVKVSIIKLFSASFQPQERN